MKTGCYVWQVNFLIKMKNVSLSSTYMFTTVSTAKELNTNSSPLLTEKFLYVFTSEFTYKKNKQRVSELLCNLKFLVIFEIY